jgi:hypothetical protein
MKIAILGWGSLIWNSEELKFDKNIGWNQEGPILPIEFARISQNGRLTLVITEEGNDVKTLYAISIENSVENALQNLRKREGTTTAKIGFYDKAKELFFPENFQYKQNILSWVKDKDIDAVIWTNLGENWNSKTQNRIDYLKSLVGETKDEAKKYIINTPEQIQTFLRKQIEKDLNWK